MSPGKRFSKNPKRTQSQKEQRQAFCSGHGSHGTPCLGDLKRVVLAAQASQFWGKVGIITATKVVAVLIAITYVKHFFCNNCHLFMKNTLAIAAITSASGFNI